MDALLGGTALLAVFVAMAGIYAVNHPRGDSGIANAAATDHANANANVKVSFVEDPPPLSVSSNTAPGSNDQFLRDVQAAVSRFKKDIFSKLKDVKFEEIQQIMTDSVYTSQTFDHVNIKTVIAVCAVGLWGNTNVFSIIVKGDDIEATAWTWRNTNPFTLFVVESGANVSCAIMDKYSLEIHVFDAVRNYEFNLDKVKERLTTKPSDVLKNPDNADTMFDNLMANNEPGKIINKEAKQHANITSDVNLSGAWAVFYAFAYVMNKGNMPRRKYGTMFDDRAFVGGIDIKAFWEAVVKGITAFNAAAKKDAPKRKPNNNNNNNNRPWGRRN